MPRRLTAVAAACLFGVLTAAQPPSAAGQMTTPLMGYGTPGPNTTELFLSIYLDRLLEVDDLHYRYEAVFYFYLTWRDPAAYDTVQAATRAWLAGNASCAHQCSDWVGAQACCDGLFQPAVFFRNAYAFPQDRATGYKIYALPAPNSSVLWTQFVHGVWYQPMDLRHFPFDSWDLMMSLEVLDTSVPPHPGVTVKVSSSGPQLYSYGQGDAVSQWEVQALSVEVIPSVDSVAWFKARLEAHSPIPSNPDDPLGLTNSNAAVLRGCPPGATSAQESNNVTMVVVKLRIQRFWRYQLLMTVLPVVLLGLLSFVVFFLDQKELSTRLGVCVTLFLALAAVQFVIANNQPASSYVLPTQQLIIATYVLLVTIAVESILVHTVATFKAAAQAAAARRAARDRHRRALKATAAAAAVADACAASGQGDSEALRIKVPPSPISTTTAGGTPRSGAPFGSSAAEAPAPQPEAAAVGSDARPAAPADRQGSGGRRQVLRIDSLSQDAQYDDYLAFTIDRGAAAFLLFGYCLTTILIFTLQSGYINIFPPA